MQGHWRTGVFLLLLIVGDEARRIHVATNEGSPASLQLGGRRQAAAERRVARREEMSHNASDADIAQRILGGLALEGEPGQRMEMARGWLTLRGRRGGADPRRVALLRSLPEAGSAVLELYPFADVNEDDFLSGAEPYVQQGRYVQPSETLILRTDDLAAGEQQAGEELIKLVGEYRSKTEDARRITLRFGSERSHLALRVKGDATWLKVGGPQDVTGAWLRAIRVVQSTGTCLETGRCTMQCTYIHGEDTCNSDFFCKRELQHDPMAPSFWFQVPTRPRCFPRVGAEANKKAWESMKADVDYYAGEIEQKKCVTSCKPFWNRASKSGQLAMGLKQQLDEIAGDAAAWDALPDDMKPVLSTIRGEAAGVVAANSDKLGRAFDANRRGRFSLLGKALRDKGCKDLPDGFIQAISRAQVQSSDVDAWRELRPFEEACPLFEELSIARESGLEGIVQEAHELESLILNRTSAAEREALASQETYIGQASECGPGSTVILDRSKCLDSVGALHDAGMRDVNDAGLPPGCYREHAGGVSSGARGSGGREVFNSHPKASGSYSEDRVPVCEVMADIDSDAAEDFFVNDLRSGRTPTQAEARITVVGAGDERVNGMWVEDGERLDRPRYVKMDNADIQMVWSESRGAWRVLKQNFFHIARKTFYVAPVNSTDPPEVGWEVVDGQGPAPSIIRGAARRLQDNVLIWAPPESSFLEQGSGAFASASATLNATSRLTSDSARGAALAFESELVSVERARAAADSGLVFLAVYIAVAILAVLIIACLVAGCLFFLKAKSCRQAEPRYEKHCREKYMESEGPADCEQSRRYGIFCMIVGAVLFVVLLSLSHFVAPYVIADDAVAAVVIIKASAKLWSGLVWLFKGAHKANLDRWALKQGANVAKNWLRYLAAGGASASGQWLQQNNYEKCVCTLTQKKSFPRKCDSSNMRWQRLKARVIQ